MDLTSTAALVEEPDLIDGSAQVTTETTATLTEAPDTIEGSGVAATVVVGALVEEPDRIAGSGVVRIVATGALVEEPDRMSGNARGYFIPTPQPAAPYVPPVKTTPKLVPFLDLPQPPRDYDADWMMNNQQRIIEHLNNMISEVSGTTGTLYYSPSGKAFELSVDDDGKPVFTYRQG